MFSVGNVSQNAARDSAEIPEALVKELEQRLNSMRDPLLPYDEDIEFHDAIRAIAMKQFHHTYGDGSSSSGDNSDDDDDDDDEDDLKGAAAVKHHSHGGPSSSDAGGEQDKKSSSTRARIRGFLRSIQVHLGSSGGAGEQGTSGQ
ncbi:hypothetical protein GGTG_08361 [Gaeumannomyces tritici R3-111a-1]|uniref:Uncharacterized protein n=1 Tax=Gaeumannomyces tritici (strain R3-111a-1) TaxID=644352 RepID=J3P4C5_GAET3|nr:hypothetical protein GGTG_08361 [Gaeumannomyces tritici R3-111a-1]EJT74521.1 hypothetical protein GGTG_08361 [Gaeumannomyces tritici R3-111a-1]